MNHAEFHQAVVALAEGRYCSTQVQATTNSEGQVTVAWSAYVSTTDGGHGWTNDYPTPEEALAELRGESKPEPEMRLEDIGASPVPAEVVTEI
jgi:hypothetical protein